MVFLVASLSEQEKSRNTDNRKIYNFIQFSRFSRNYDGPSRHSSSYHTSWSFKNKGIGVCKVILVVFLY